MNKLKGKNVLITGGASGIGKAIAKRFIDEGAHVTVFDYNKENIRLLKSEFFQLEAIMEVDVSDAKSVKEAFSQLDKNFDRIDVLINNAGISYRHKSFRHIKTSDWDKTIQTNLSSMFYVSSEVLKRMDEGVILNMSSINALRAFPHYADYNAAKAGVIALTRTMAFELAPKIRVNAVCPGAVMTPMQMAEYTDEMFEEVNNNIPLGRHASPEEIAAFFTFLASDEASFMTGHEYVIDGGEIS